MNNKSSINNQETTQSGDNSNSMEKLVTYNANTNSLDGYTITPSSNEYTKPIADQNGLHSGTQEYVIWNTKKTIANCKYTIKVIFTQNNRFEIGFGQYNDDDEFIVKAEHTINKNNVSTIRAKNGKDAEGITPHAGEETVYEFVLKENICTINITSNGKTTTYKDIGEVAKNCYFFIRKWGTGEILVKSIVYEGMEDAFGLLDLSEDKIENAKKLQKKEKCKTVNPQTGTVKCNICGYESDHEFLHQGTVPRPNEKCPICRSLKRTRLYMYYLENYTNILEGNDYKILHTAPETSVYQKLKLHFGDNYISSDVKDGKYVDKLIDIQDIPYDDNTFDLIITSHVLEHVPDDDKALREFYRVLKPEGMIIIEIPALYYLDKTFEETQINSSNLRRKYYKQFDHQRYYSVEDVLKKMDNAGFTILREEMNIIPENNFDDGLKYAMIPDPDYALERFYNDYDDNQPDSENVKKQYLTPDPLFIGVKRNKEPVRAEAEEEKENYCNICDSNVTFIIDEEDDKICPHCNSTGDERLIYGEIVDKINQNTSILHINPGKTLENKLKTLTTEYDGSIKESDLTESLKNIKDNTFDIIITTHLLDRQENDREVLTQLYRILGSNGTLILKENTDLELSDKIDEEFINTPILRKMFYGDRDALRCYGFDLIHFLEFTGFNVNYDNPDNQINNILLKNHLVKNPLLICNKK